MINDKDDKTFELLDNDNSIWDRTKPSTFTSVRLISQQELR